MSAPRQLGSYELVSRIGEGGMGEVWRGMHEHLGRPAAIKLIRPDSLGADAIERFQREARATSALKSPHTIQLFDFGVAPDGTFFYAMELLEGCSLQALVAHNGPIAAERVVYLLKQICESLVEAHHQGLVHRDIKPANIFLCRLGMDVDFVKLLDFGLVKFGASSKFEAATLTLKDSAQGTPAFMPPEVTGGSAAFDERSDLYAVGCVAYWLLCGELVFTGNSPLDIVMAHIQQEPDPPSKRTGLPIPEALEQLVMQCLAKKPDARPQSARELLDALRKIEFQTPWDAERASNWWLSHHPENWGVEPVATVDPGEIGTLATAEKPRSSALPWLAFAGAVAVVAVTAWVMGLGGAPEEPPPEPEVPVEAAPPSPEPAVAPAPPEDCRVAANGPASRWTAVTEGVSDRVTWVSPDTPELLSAILTFHGRKAESGAERWKSCRWAVMRVGNDDTEVCRECVTKEYTFATLGDVEAWHNGFVSTLGRQCTDASIAAIDALCAADDG